MEPSADTTEARSAMAIELDATLQFVEGMEFSIMSGSGQHIS
ncbi:MAG TPA: hypothetical protein VFU69_00200 [Ktedonobacterales bacterium]|nr:hypothetical protein [Ktedonobacterales bacterium]